MNASASACVRPAAHEQLSGTGVAAMATRTQEAPGPERATRDSVEEGT